MRRRELDILFVASRVVLLFWLSLHISDLGLYLDYARKVIPGGQIPYVNFDFEYPPLAYPLIAIPAWIHDLLRFRDTESYRVIFGLFLMPFDVLLYARFRRRPPFESAPFAYILLTGALGLLLYDRFDLVVGFVLAWPFLSERPKGDLRYSFWWGIGGALKIVPLLAAPARVLEWEGGLRERALRLVKFSAVALGPLLLCCVLVAVFAHGKISFLSHHSDRGVQIESLLGSLVMFLHTYTPWVQTKVEWNFGGQHLAPIPWLVTLSRVMLYGSLTFTYGMLALPRFRRDALSGAWLALASFVTFGYVLSPQYFLWLVPLGICAAGRVPDGSQRRVWIGLFGLIVALTGFHFRYYFDYVNFHYFAVGLVLMRNLCLLALWALSWLWMGRPDGGRLRPYDTAGSP